MRHQHNNGNLAAVVVAVVAVIALALVCGVALGQETPPEPLRPSGRVAPGSAGGASCTAECKWVQTPWGSAGCRIRPEDCVLNLVPMFINTDNRFLKVQLKTDKGDSREYTINWSDGGSKKLEIQFDDPLKWAEFWSRMPGEEHGPHPVMGCYCDERRNVLVVCANGSCLEERSRSRSVPAGVEDLGLGYEFLRTRWIMEDELRDIWARRVAGAMHAEIKRAGNRRAIVMEHERAELERRIGHKLKEEPWTR